MKIAQIGFSSKDNDIECFFFENPPERPREPEACGLRHLTFAVDNIDEAMAYLHDTDVEPVRIDPITGKRFTFFRDPDGSPFELYETLTRRNG